MLSNPRWVHVASLSQLTLGKPKLVHAEAHDIVLTRGEDDVVYAIHNVCPHEGYPLVQGVVSGAVLTCAWHNFKFDLRDGRCVLGEEDVRAYPVQLLEGEVWVDIAEPDPEIVRGAQSRALVLALREGRVGQALRAIGRGLQAGARPEQLLTVLAAYDGRVSEYGSTHVIAVAADLARLLPGAPGMGDPDPSGSIERPLTILAQLVDTICMEHGRREARPVPDATIWDKQTGPEALRMVKSTLDIAGRTPASAEATLALLDGAPPPLERALRTGLLYYAARYDEIVSAADATPTDLQLRALAADARRKQRDLEDAWRRATAVVEAPEGAAGLAVEDALVSACCCLGFVSLERLRSGVGPAQVALDWFERARAAAAPVGGSSAHGAHGQRPCGSSTKSSTTPLNTPS